MLSKMPALQEMFDNLHPYFAHGDFAEKYVAAIGMAFPLDTGKKTRYDRAKYVDILKRRPNESLERIARDYNVIPERIRQIQEKALRILRLYVLTNREIFDGFYASEVEEGHVALSPTERHWYAMYASAMDAVHEREMMMGNLERRIAELEMQRSQEITGKNDANIYQMQVRDLGLPNMVINAVRRLGVPTVAGLSESYIHDLLYRKTSKGMQGNIGDDSMRRIEVALGYLGLHLKDSDTYPFPSQEELYQMPTSFILSSRSSVKLRQHSIETVRDLAENKDRLQDALGPDLREEVLRAMRFYNIQ